jgi:hypothetical protein
MDIKEVAKQLFTLRKEVKEIEEKHKNEIDPKKAQMAELQTLFISMLNEQGLKSIKTSDANFAITTRKGYTIVNEAQAREWVKENNIFGIDKTLLAQKLKQIETIPDFFEAVESQSLTVKAVN